VGPSVSPLERACRGRDLRVGGRAMGIHDRVVFSGRRSERCARTAAFWRDPPLPLTRRGHAAQVRIVASISSIAKRNSGRVLDAALVGVDDVSRGGQRPWCLLSRPESRAGGEASPLGALQDERFTPAALSVGGELDTREERADDQPAAGPMARLRSNDPVTRPSAFRDEEVSSAKGPSNPPHRPSRAPCATSGQAAGF
jgi:hypothetical protein